MAKYQTGYVNYSVQKKKSHIHPLKPYAKQARQRRQKQQRAAQQRAYQRMSPVGKVAYKVTHSKAYHAVSNTAKKVYKNVTHEIRRESHANNYGNRMQRERQRIINNNKKTNKVSRNITRSLSKSSAGRATIGATHGFANGVTLGAADLGAKAEGYKNYSAYRRSKVSKSAQELSKAQEKKLKSSKAYKRGYAAGDMASYAVGYSGAGKAIGKGAAKVAGSKLGRKAIAKATKAGVEELGKGTVKAAERAAVRTGEKATAKAVERGAVKRAASKATGKVVSQTVKANVKAEVKAAAKEAGKKMTRQEVKKETAKRLAKMSAKEARGRAGKAAGKIGREIAKDAVGDLTVGAAMDNAHELQNGVTPLKKGKDGKYHVNKQYVKDMGVNAAQNVAIGGVMDTVPGMLKGAAKTAKKGKKATKTIERLGPDGKVHKVKVARAEGEEAVTHAAEKARHSEAGKKGAVTRRHNKARKNILEQSNDATKELREKAKTRLTQRPAFSERVNAVQSVKEAKRSPASMLREQDFVDHLKNEGIKYRTLTERAAKNGTTPGEELTKEHRKFSAQKVLEEREAKSAVKKPNAPKLDVDTEEIANAKSRIREIRKQKQKLEKQINDNGLAVFGESTRPTSYSASGATQFHSGGDPEVLARLDKKGKRLQKQLDALDEEEKRLEKTTGPVEREQKYSESKEVENNMSDEALGYFDNQQSNVESFVKRDEGMSDKEYADKVNAYVENSIRRTAKDNPDSIKYWSDRYKKIGEQVRDPATTNSTNTVAANVEKSKSAIAGETPEQTAAREAREQDMTLEKGLPQSNEELVTTLRNAERSEGTAEALGKQAEVTNYVTNTKSKRTALGEMLNDANKRWFDSAAGVARVAKEYKDRMIDATWDGIRRRVARANQLVNGKGFYNSAGERVGDSLREVLDPIVKQGEEKYAEFQRFCYHLHNIDREMYNKSVFNTPLNEEAEMKRIADEMGVKKKPYKQANGKTKAEYPEEVKAEYNKLLKQRSDASRAEANKILEANPEFKEAHDNLMKYIHNVNMLSVESGVMSKEQLKRLEEMYPNYVPTHRVKYMNSSAGFGANGHAVTGRNLLKKATGSNSDLAPLQDQLAAFTSKVVNRSAYNDFGLRLMRDINDKSVLKDIEPIELKDAKSAIGDTEIKTSAADEVANGIKEGKKKEDPFKVDLQDIVQDKNGDYTMTVVQGGKTAYRFTIDKDIFDAFKAMENSGAHDIKMLKGMNTIFRNLVTTWNPLFPIFNGAKDFLDAGAYSQYGTGQFLKSYANAWRLIAKNDNLWKVYQNISGTGNTVRDIVEDVSAKGFDRYTGKGGRIPWAAKGLMDRVESVNQMVEQAPRFAEFLSTIKKEGLDKDGITPDVLKLAAYNANEITENFNRSGTVGRYLNANGATFLNAGLQDVARTVKLASTKKGMGRLMFNAAVFGMAPSLVNEILVGDDPAYQRIRTEDKDKYFFIPIGDGKFAKIPKGRVTGTISAVPQRAVRYLMGNTDKNETPFQGLAQTAIDQTAPNNPLTSNLAAPFIQSGIMNNDSQGQTWYGTPVVGSADSKKPQAEQYDENTSELAKWLGKRLNKSPEKIDYIIKQSTGAIGQAIPSMPGIGSLAKTGRGSGLGNVVKNYLTSRTITDTKTSNKRLSDFYDRLGKLEENKNSQNASTYDKAVYSYMYKKSGELGDYSKQVAKIEGDKKLTTSEKLKEIRKIRLKQTKAAEKVMKMEGDYKKVYNQVKGKYKLSDYKDSENPEQSMQQAMNKDISRRVAKMNGENMTEYDFNNTLSSDDRKLYKGAKKAGVSKQEFVDYRTAYKRLYKRRKENDTTPSVVDKANLALKYGADNHKQANKMVGGEGLSDRAWHTAKRMRKDPNYRRYYKKSQDIPRYAKGDTNFEAKTYLAVKYGKADTMEEAAKVMGTSTSNIHKSTWTKAVYAYNHGVSSKFIANATSKKWDKYTKKGGKGWRNPQLTYQFVQRHWHNRRDRINAWNMLKYNYKTWNGYSF